MECAFCGIELDQKDIGAALMQGDEPTIKCHGCGTINKVVLEIE